MKVDLDKLEALAKAATPGPWREGSQERHHVFVANAHPEALGTERVLLRMNVHWPHEDDAKYIAAASPDVVLALLDEVRAFRAGLAPFTAERCACGHRRVQHLFDCKAGDCDCKRFRKPDVSP